MYCTDLRFQVIPGNIMINIRKLHSKLATVPLPCRPLPEGPLVCLSMLWLQDLCIQCVITVPTLSSESLWRRLSDCSPRHTDPSVCHTDFPFIYTSSFSFPCPSRRPNSLVILFFHVLFPPPSNTHDWRFSLILLPSCLLLGLSSASLHPPLATPALIFSKCLCVIGVPQNHALGTRQC